MRYSGQRITAFNAAAWIESVEAIPGITLWLAKKLGRHATGMGLHSFHHMDEMTHEGYRQFNKLKAKMKAADGVEAVEAELLRRGRVLGPTS
jgi:hypothetical protein